MSIAAGALSIVSVGTTTASLSSAVATGGTAPYTYQWKRSLSSGSGYSNITGATSLTLSDSGLLPATTYYYEVVATDSASPSPASATSSALLVLTTAAIPSPNQLVQQPYLGMNELPFNGNSISVLFDPAGSGSLSSGAAVKFSVGSAPSGGFIVGNQVMVVPCTAAADGCAGFVDYNMKSVSFRPGDSLEVSLGGNIKFLQAQAAISRGNFLTSLPAGAAGGTAGGVVPVTGSSTLPIVGWSLDTVAAGQLVRVMIMAPQASYQIDG